MPSPRTAITPKPRKYSGRTISIRVPSLPRLFRHRTSIKSKISVVINSSADTKGRAQQETNFHREWIEEIQVTNKLVRQVREVSDQVLSLQERIAGKELQLFAANDYDAEGMRAYRATYEELMSNTTKQESAFLTQVGSRRSPSARQEQQSLRTQLRWLMVRAMIMRKYFSGLDGVQSGTHLFDAVDRTNRAVDA
jgi:hypothetical protein